MGGFSANKKYLGSKQCFSGARHLNSISPVPFESPQMPPRRPTHVKTAAFVSLRGPSTFSYFFNRTSLLMEPDIWNFYPFILAYNQQQQKIKKKSDFFFSPPKNKNSKNRKKRPSQNLFSSKSRTSVLATPFEGFTQELVWIQFKGKISACKKDFFIYALFFFL